MTETTPCTSCGAPLAPHQRYCLECGERRGPQRRRLHWAVPVAVAALVAAGGAAVAVAAGADDPGTATLVAISPLRPAPSPAPGGDAAIRAWPRRDGATIVLGVIPATSPETVAVARARRAARGGLTDVGILRSDEFASLHPGYRVVFAGVYDELGDALVALPRARSRFPNAYAQEIVR